MSHRSGSAISPWTPESNLLGRLSAPNSAVPNAVRGITDGGGSNGSPGKAARKPGSLVGPFKERSQQQAQQSSLGNARKTVQPPMSHGAKALQRPEVPASTGPFQQQQQQQTSSRIVSGNSTQQQQTAPANSSNPSSSRPASKHAAASVAAAEAAVSAAAAALKTSHQQTGRQQPVRAVRIPAQDQKQQRRNLKLAKGSPRERINNALGFATSNEPGHESAADGMAFAPLQVQGVKPTNQRQQQSGNGSASPGSTTAALRSGSPGQVLPANLQQQQCLYSQLLQYSAAGVPVSPAIAAAAQAVSKRLRIQQRSRQGPPPFQRGPLPRPRSPPPLELTGDLLLASCPDANSAGDATAVDLSSSNVTSIYTPVAAADGEAAQSAKAGPPFTDFTQLGVLDLSDNKLSCFAGLAWLPALWQLAVSANRLRSLQSLSAVLGYQQPDATAEAQAKPNAEAPASSSGYGGESLVSGPLQDSRQSSTAGDSRLGSSESSRSKEDSTPGAPSEDASGPNETAAADEADTAVSDTAGGDIAATGTAGTEDVPHSAQSSRPASATLSSQQQEVEHRSSSEGEVAEAADAHVLAEAEPQQSIAVCPDGFSQLEVLDLSYNMLPADQLLGVWSPLARLPRLRELLVAGNSLSALPVDLGPFTSLSHLDLSQNKLTGAALLPLGQLPALSQLLLSHNPIKAVPDTVAAFRCSENPSASPAAAEQQAQSEAAIGGFRELSWLDLSQSRLNDVEQLLPLLELPKLCVLQLIGTPLAEQCHSGRNAVQALQREGLTIITHQQAPQVLWQHSSKQRNKHSKHHQQHSAASSSRLLPVTVDEDAMPGHVLAAAGRNAIVELQHDQLVAAFGRVGEGIDSWQLAPVAEESSTAMQLEAEEEQRESEQRGAGRKTASGIDDEPIQDQTFLTGVGITGQLPEDDNEAPADNIDEFQDPTERLAIALGLQITQLAHYTHKDPGNPTGPIHRLRHALAHPLVDPEAGERPQQHHAAMTAAAAAKQRPRQLLPLPQPIPTTLDTRVVAVQGIDSLLQGMRGRLQVLEGSLLQQLQAQADKLSAASQQMTQSAAAEVKTGVEQQTMDSPRT